MMSKGRLKIRNFWKHEEELILKEWGDKAQCFYWMHLKAHRKYKIWNAAFIIPVIVISTITGTASFASSSFGSYQEAGTMVIGALNILNGIITTIYQFLKIAEVNEAHKSAALSWNKFYEQVKGILIKNPLDRDEPDETLKILAQQYNHLIEFSPIIPEKVIKQFKETFKKIEGRERMFIPNICDKFAGTRIYNQELITKILTKVNDGHISEMLGTATPMARNSSDMNSEATPTSPMNFSALNDSSSDTDIITKNNIERIVSESLEKFFQNTAQIKQEQDGMKLEEIVVYDTKHYPTPEITPEINYVARRQSNQTHMAKPLTSATPTRATTPTKAKPTRATTPTPTRATPQKQTPTQLTKMTELEPQHSESTPTTTIVDTQRADTAIIGSEDSSNEKQLYIPDEAVEEVVEETVMAVSEEAAPAEEEAAVSEEVAVS